MKCVRPQLWGTDPGESPSQTRGERSLKPRAFPAQYQPNDRCQPVSLNLHTKAMADPFTGPTLTQAHPMGSLTSSAQRQGRTLPKDMLDVRAKSRNGHISILHFRPEAASKYFFPRPVWLSWFGIIL